MASNWARAARQKKAFTDNFDKRERAYSLQRLGFHSYRAYLASDLWKGIRQRVLDRDCNQCRRCGFPATTVHHSNYGFDVMKGDRIEPLFAACGRCHQSAGHWGGAVRVMKPLAHIAIGKPHRKPPKIQPCKHWCQYCGVKLKRKNVCRKCQRHLDWHSELDREYREMFQVLASPVVWSR